MAKYHRYVGKSTVAIEVEVGWEVLIPTGIDGHSANRYFEAAARNAADAAEAPFDVNKAKVTKREASRKEMVVTRPTGVTTVPEEQAEPESEHCCTSCGTSNADCLVGIRRAGSACCSRCHSTDTHDLHGRAL